MTQPGVSFMADKPTLAEKGREGLAQSKAPGVMSEEGLCGVHLGMRVHPCYCSLSETLGQLHLGASHKFWNWAESVFVNADYANGFTTHL